VELDWTTEDSGSLLSVSSSSFAGAAAGATDGVGALRLIVA
jgi:hypothetical protein